MIELRQSTAGQEIPLGHFLDSTDGNTEETGLTIANTDIKLWKFGATTLANKNSGGGTHISNGIFYCVLDATDSDTLGGLVVFVHVAGALAVRVECAVLPANIWDSKYSTDKQQVDVVQWLGVAPLALSSQRVQTYVGAMAASVVSASAFAQAAADKVWGTAARALTDKAGFALSTAGIKAIWDQATSALTTVGSLGKLLVDNINATISSRSSHAASAIWSVGTRALTDKAGFSLSTAGIKAIWDQATSALTTVGSIGKLLVDNINATISSRSSHAASAIWSEATRALTDKAGFSLAASQEVQLNAQGKTDVNTEMLDVLVTDTHAEPASVPAATSSLKDKINWLFALARNKITQTATTQSLRNDADDADIAASTVSDNGTEAVRGEWT